jgi:hypothetical protein
MHHLCLSIGSRGPITIIDTVGYPELISPIRLAEGETHMIYRTYNIPNLLCTKVSIYQTFYILNSFFSKILLLNLFYTKVILYRTFFFQSYFIPNLFYTKIILYQFFITTFIK